MLFPRRVYKTLDCVSETSCILTAQWSCYGHPYVESSDTMVAGEIWWYGKEVSRWGFATGKKKNPMKNGEQKISTELLEVLIPNKKKAWIQCSINPHRSWTTNLCSILPVTNERISTISILIWSHCWLQRFLCKSTFYNKPFMCHTYALSAKTITLWVSKFSLFLRITESSWTS